MNFEGDLQSVDLSWVLQRVAADNCTGILTVQGVEDIVAISLLSGRIVAADSFNQTLEDGLGDVLVEQGVIGKEEFEAAAADHPGGSTGSLGDFLIQRGQISRAQLLQGLRLQTYHLMLRVLDWRVGEYKFYVGDEVSFEEGFQPISVEELLIRALQAAAGGNLQLPPLDTIYRRKPSIRKIQVLGEDGDGSGDGLWLTRPQVEFLEKVDGQQSAKELAARCHLDRYAATFYVHRLMRAELIESSTALDTATLTLRRPSDESASNLKAEIFLPPDPGADAESADLEAGARSTVWPAVVAWLPLALAALLALALISSVFQRPDQFLLPFPWQEIQRETFARQLRESLFLKFDRAARSFFLMQGHYPDRAEELVEQGLLSSSDLRDPTGYRLRYETDELRYEVAPILGAETLTAGLELSESITGDFLLDPHFTPTDSLEQPPLYLID